MQEITHILPHFYEDLDIIDEDSLPLPPLFDDEEDDNNTNLTSDHNAGIVLSSERLSRKETMESIFPLSCVLITILLKGHFTFMAKRL